MTANWLPAKSLFAGMFGLSDTIDGIFNLDGVSWSDAPIPRRWHKCKPQTKAPEQAVVRCACGALSFTDMGPLHWMERNSRRRHR